MKRISANWKTPDIQAAEDQFDDAAEAAEQKMAEADELIAELAEQDDKPSEEEINQLKAFATGPHATREWRLVAEKVDRGELTWGRIVSGKIADDPDAMAALNSSAGQGLDPEQVLGQPPAAPQRPPRKPAPRWDEEDYSQNKLMGPG